MSWTVLFEDDTLDKDIIRVVGLADATLSGIMIFPLYIINLSFLLESTTTYEQISIYNIVQLSFSLLMFLKAPVTFFMASSEKDTYRTLAEIIDKDIADEEEDETFRKKVVKILTIVFAFGPMVLLEIIHFFPFCFAYYRGM